MYRVTRITGSQDNILGIAFSENEASENNKEKIELIEWEAKEGAAIMATGEQVLEQVLAGLKKANEELGKNYQLSEIHFLPSDNASGSIYEFLIQALVKHYDTGSDFLEIAS